ncbi:hypothetical protein PSTG_19009, partial [Puccinia striiformis f. sp. tritici PST-78]
MTRNQHQPQHQSLHYPVSYRPIRSSLFPQTLLQPIDRFRSPSAYENNNINIQPTYEEGLTPSNYPPRQPLPNPPRIMSTDHTINRFKRNSRPFSEEPSPTTMSPATDTMPTNQHHHHHHQPPPVEDQPPSKKPRLNYSQLQSHQEAEEEEEK